MNENLIKHNRRCPIFYHFSFENACVNLKLNLSKMNSSTELCKLWDSVFLFDWKKARHLLCSCLLVFFSVLKLSTPPGPSVSTALAFIWEIEGGWNRVRIVRMVYLHRLFVILALDYENQVMTQTVFKKNL